MSEFDLLKPSCRRTGSIFLQGRVPATWRHAADMAKFRSHDDCAQGRRPIGVFRVAIRPDRGEGWTADGPIQPE